jgi:hypothetical protein
MIARERAKEAYTSGDDRDKEVPVDTAKVRPYSSDRDWDAIEKEW